MANRFLVSTTHHLLAVDTDRNSVWHVHSGSGLYFGLAAGENGLLYVAARNSIQGPQDVDARASEHGSVLVMDEKFCLRDELRPPFPLRDVHGIACFDGRLWVTCSFDNMIAMHDLATGNWSRWYPAPNPAHRGRDVHHFNTIRFLRGQVCLVAHHFGASKLLFFDYPSLQLASVATLGVMAHDLFYQGELATCSSGEGCIVNSQGQRLRTGNFPRGVAATGQGTLLGMSINRPRDERQQQDGILRWYGPDWRFQTDYLLPGAGMVLDILHLADRKFRWDALETWPHAEITPGGYNRLSPANVYLADSFGLTIPRTALLDWHAPEGTHRWTAARETSLSILINPEETRLSVELSSQNPNPYQVEIWLNHKLLDTVVFDGSGVERREFCIASEPRGAASLLFRVPNLWKPAEVFPGNHDGRLLGVAVHRVSLN